MTPRVDTPTVRSKNLDVHGLDQEPNFGGIKGDKREKAQPPLLSSLGAHTAQATKQPAEPLQQYCLGGTRYVTLPQATNIIEAIHFAKSLRLPLVAHLTIHWAYTDIGDDANGELFATWRVPDGGYCAFEQNFADPAANTGRPLRGA